MKYLVVKCEELSDQYECDANRTPFCLTDDYSSFGVGYEVYEILPNNKFKLIKDYEDCLEKGIAIYYWKGSSSCDGNGCPDKTLKKFKNETHDDFSKSRIKKIKTQYGFKESIEEIYSDVRYCGSHGEEINNKWIVIGEYRDNIFSCGF